MFLFCLAGQFIGKIFGEGSCLFPLHTWLAMFFFIAVN